MRLFALTLALCACAPARPEGAALVLHSAEAADAVAWALRGLEPGRFVTREAPAPRVVAAGEPGLVLAVERDAALCGECYRVERAGPRVVVTGGGALGLRYGVTHWLEALGYGFFHPFRTRAPTALPKEPALEPGVHAPEIARRGLHLHTLHPIEALFDFWVPGEAERERAQATIDWVLRHRGNYVQWAALEDILAPEVGGPWRAHTKALADYAHAQGAGVGLTVQLFAKASLQQSYTLVDPARPDDDAALRARLELVAGGLGLDNLNISFGEFFGADAAQFIDRVDAAHALLEAVSLGTGMSAVIHVGDTPELRVTWGGREQLYYFLVRYVNPAVLPRVHTVMFYNLFDPAGGAYRHRDFAEHRDFLRERLEAGLPVSYYPESAYWIAFDNAVPMYLPVYLRSRYLDLEGIRAMSVTPLAEHLLFSSGWEWGYWQNDAVGLRLSYRLTPRLEDALDELFGDARVTSLVTRLGDEQRRALILEALAPYLAGRDQVIDAADVLGHVAAPDRPDFHEVDAAFAPTLAQLATHAEAVEALAREAGALPTDDPFVREVVDGVELTAARARFAWAVFGAAHAHATGAAPASFLAAAAAQLEVARRVTLRRRRDFHHPVPASLVATAPNPSFYDYGYLRDAMSLCFWRRELAQLRNLVEGAGLPVPGCVL